MKTGVADSIVDASISLEKFFYERFPDIYEDHKQKQRKAWRDKKIHLPPLTLGNPIFAEEVEKLLPHQSYKLFKWFNRTRNSIIHYGDSEKKIAENEAIRKSTNQKDIDKSLMTLIMLLEFAEKSEQQNIENVCKKHLTKKVFDEVFGNPREATPPMDYRNRQSPQGGTPTKSPSEKKRDIFAEIGAGEPLQKLSSGNNGSKNRIELDLLDDSKKPSRRQRQKIEAEAVIAPSKLDKDKANALDLFSDEGKPKERVKAAAPKDLVGGITKVLVKEDESANSVKGTHVAHSAAPSREDQVDDDSESDDPKLIVIKPPILGSDLAARLGLPWFNVNADLIKLGVFAAPKQPLEPEIVEQVCIIHGFTFERK